MTLVFFQERKPPVSALEQVPYERSNRRKIERVNIAGSIGVVFGRGEGVLIDLSQRGARIRHFAPVRRGATVRISFEWERTRFSATAEVLASRVISLGLGPSYESRVRFTYVDDESERLLAAAIEQIVGRNTRRWVANLRGWSDETQPAEVTPFHTSSFIRCRLIGNRWEIKRTNDQQQPRDGFVLPPESGDSDIESLCDNYSRGGDEERQLIRLLAAAAVDQSLAKQ
jgi:hypothetical protein